MSTKSAKRSSLQDQMVEKTDMEFRDVDIENEVFAYILQVNPAMSNLVAREWLTEALLPAILDIVREIRAPMPKHSLWREMKDRGVVPSDLDSEEDYWAAIEAIYEIDATQIPESTIRHEVLQLVRMYESREMIRAAADTVDKVGNGFDLEEVRGRFRDLSRGITLYDESREGEVREYGSFRELARLRQEQKDNGEEVSGGSIPTGIGGFDRMFGGVARGEFMVIGGLPGSGKTATVGTILVNGFHSGYNGLLVSGEMSKYELQARLYADIARIPATKFRMTDMEDADFARLDAAIQRLEINDNYLYIASFSRGFTAEDVENLMFKLKDKYGHGVDMVGTDYLNIMKPVGATQGNSREWTSQADVVWEVKYLCDQHGVAGFAPNQLTDEAYGKSLYSLSHFKYARAISEAAPIAVALLKEDDDSDDDTSLGLQVLKMRNAPLDNPITVRLNPNMRYMRVHDSETYGRKSLNDITSDDVREIDPEREANKRKNKRGKNSGKGKTKEQ